MKIVMDSFRSRSRAPFVAWLTAALVLLTAAALTWNLGFAMAGAVIAFAAGEEKGGQILCNGCAGRMVPDPETAYH